MTEEYIDHHFDEIIAHESDIESRLIEADCTLEDLKECNRWFIDTFSRSGEKIVLIENDYNSALADLLESL